MNPFGFVSFFRFRRTGIPANRRANRRLKPMLEPLEDRTVLSAALPTGIYDVPTGAPALRSLVEGPDGNVWVCEYEGDAIARVTPSGVVTQFALPQPDSLPHDITVGPDNNSIWFSEPGVNKIGEMDLNGNVIRQFTLTTTPPSSFANIECLDVDANGNFWFSEYTGNKIGKLDPSTGQFTEYAVPTPNGGPAGLVIDGNYVWFTEYNSDKVGRLDAATGQIVEFTTPTPNSQPWDMTDAPDGDLWFTEVAGDKIGRIDASGRITEFATSDPNAGPWAITAGPDGNIWFSENGTNQVARMNLSGTITGVFDVPTADSFPFAMTVVNDQIWMTENVTNKIAIISTDGGITETTTPFTGATQPEQVVTDNAGNLWFTEPFADKIGELAPDGTRTDFAIPTPDSQPTGITLGLDGAIWFTESAGDKIGRITSDGTITEYALPAGADPQDITTGPYPTYDVGGAQPFGASPQSDSDISTGFLWFTEAGAGFGVATIQDFGASTGNVVQQFNLGVTVHGIVAVDDDLYVTAPAANQIWELSEGATATATNLNLPLTANSMPWEITTGPNGTIWFTEQNANQIAEIDNADEPHFQEFKIPTANSKPWGIVEGPDGFMYFTEQNASQIGLVNFFTGAITELPTPQANSQPEGIAVGPNKTIVFAESGVNYLGTRPVLPTIGPGTGGNLLASTTNSNGDPVTFVVSADGALWENNPQFPGIGWEEISQPGGFTFISATKDATGDPVVFGVTADGSLWENDAAVGYWVQISTPGGFTAVSATQNASGAAVVFAVPSGGSLWEHDPTFSYPWLEVSTPGGFTAVAATRDAAGGAVAFVVPSDGSLWEFDAAFSYPWLEVSTPGGFTAISATRDASGDPVLFAVPGDGSLWELESDVLAKHLHAGRLHVDQRDAGRFRQCGGVRGPVRRLPVGVRHGLQRQRVGGDLRPRRLHGDQRDGEPFAGSGGVRLAGRPERLGEQPGLRRLDANLFVSAARGGSAVWSIRPDTGIMGQRESFRECLHLWWGPWSSKPVGGLNKALCGFDSHTLPLFRPPPTPLEAPV